MIPIQTLSTQCYCRIILAFLMLEIEYLDQKIIKSLLEKFSAWLLCNGVDGTLINQKPQHITSNTHH
jgi:hypothetical protein